MAQNAWSPLPVVNIVKEALEKATKGGKIPVKESDLIAYIESEQYWGYKPSRADVANALITLETLGYVHVKSSGWKERIIYYRPRPAFR